MPENSIDLANKGFVIIGGRGGGKSTLAKHILDSNDDHIVYDPMNEYEGYRRYVPEDRNDVHEMDRFVTDTVIQYGPDLFVLEESSQYIPPKPNRLTPGMQSLVDLSRHWGISWGCIARRPSQIHTDVIELAAYLFIFELHGRNDIRTLNDYHVGLGDEVNGLSDHHFAVLEHGRKLTIHAPLDNINTNEADAFRPPERLTAERGVRDAR